MNRVYASDIASFLEAELQGIDFAVEGTSSMSHPKSFTVGYRCGRLTTDDFTISPLLVLCKPEHSGQKEGGITVICCENPMESFSRVKTEFFMRTRYGIAKSAFISPDAELDPTVVVMQKAVIEEGVRIGAESIIESGVVLKEGTIVGSHCRIGSNSVIGGEGLSSFKGVNGSLTHMPHSGKVIIGDNVLIGPLCSVARGTIDNTVIGSSVHIGPMVNIGHNTIIEDNCLIAGRVHVSGSAKILTSATLWANSVIRDHITIGEGATVGIGAIVTEDVRGFEKLAAVPGVSLRRLARFMQSNSWR